LSEHGEGPSIDLEDYPVSPFFSPYTTISPGEIPYFNPLKGFMPYAEEYSVLDYSMEYTYFNEENLQLVNGWLKVGEIGS